MCCKWLSLPHHLFSMKQNSLLTAQGREQRAVFPVVTFVALAEVEQQEHIHQHPHQRGGQHHLTVDEPPHRLRQPGKGGSRRELSSAQPAGEAREGEVTGRRRSRWDREASSWRRKKKKKNSTTRWNSKSNDDIIVCLLEILNESKSLKLGCPEIIGVDMNIISSKSLREHI